MGENQNYDNTKMVIKTSDCPKNESEFFSDKTSKNILGLCQSNFTTTTTKIYLPTRSLDAKRTLSIYFSKRFVFTKKNYI